jgi:hypothetical protein
MKGCRLWDSSLGCQVMRVPCQFPVYRWKVSGVATSTISTWLRMPLRLFKADKPHFDIYVRYPFSLNQAIALSTATWIGV